MSKAKIPRATAARNVPDEYAEFLARKAQEGTFDGFAPTFMPTVLFDVQAHLVDWSVRKGRCALFEDCGLGKTLQKLVWAQNVVEHTNGRVLDLNPLAVSAQTVREGEKFGIECHLALDGKTRPGINVVNYERLHLFDPADFVGAICDESAILKSFDGVRRREITEFMRRMKYRLLLTATPSPNEYIELGTSSEALGYLGYMDMLSKFFKNLQGNSIKPHVRRQRHSEPDRDLMETAKWRFKGHAEQPFWRWVSSWARAVRKPSDLGFDDGSFVLPPLTERQHMVDSNTRPTGMLFALPAVGLAEQRDERRRTIEERCAKAAKLATHGDPVIIWCHLNDEGDELARMIKGSVQVSGKDTEDEKEEKFLGFIDGSIRALVIKPKIGAWGLNFQHCAHSITFPSHSFESYYQSIRRCWRFGQTRPVVSDIITTEGEKTVLQNLQRKAAAADRMFASLVAHMNDAMSVRRSVEFTKEIEAPSWL